MEQLAVVAIDLAAIGLLALAVYFPRHRRRDLAVALIGINVGVLAVAMILSSATVGAGLGIGLFGVLSIIRLRSREIEQSEIAYYFSALAIGLICGLSTTVTPLAIILVALVIGTMALIDNPRLFRRYREQTVVLDRALADDHELAVHAQNLLGRPVEIIRVRDLDFVSDKTVVDVRYALPRGRAGVRANELAGR